MSHTTKIVFLSSWRAVGHGALLHILGILFVLDLHSPQMRRMALSDRGNLISPAAHLGRGLGWVTRSWGKFWHPGFGSQMSTGVMMLWTSGDLFAAFRTVSVGARSKCLSFGEGFCVDNSTIMLLWIDQIHHDGAPHMTRIARKPGNVAIEVRTADYDETEFCLCAEI